MHKAAERGQVGGEAEGGGLQLVEQCWDSWTVELAAGGQLCLNPNLMKPPSLFGARITRNSAREREREGDRKEHSELEGERVGARESNGEKEALWEDEKKIEVC